MRPHVLLLCLFILSSTQAAELHVALNGSDFNTGRPDAPLRTIQRGAELARPGDVITVHQGIYRERVNPPRGGESESNRIVYQAAPGETVEIRGSEILKNWTRLHDDVWSVTIPNSFFGAFNPYSDLIHGDWFDSRGRQHHTGAVYLNGHWLPEAAKLEDVLASANDQPQWFGQVEADKTTLVARFKGVDPNVQTTEINVRRTVFYPEKPGINFLTVRGFTMRHAATPWAPPTAEQVGLIGTHWSRGWIIERNIVSHSICSGISLGKYGDEWDNKSANTAEGYVQTINRALNNGWNRRTVGHHIVRDNTISHCEQAGIVGSMGAAFSIVTGNTIHDIHVRRLFTGAEMAGIKFHGAIDVEISRNHIHHTCLGLWLDWMAQGAFVSANLFHDNGNDLFVEVNHGPFIVSNNLFLSPMSLLNYSQGGAYAHNLFAGAIQVNSFDARLTPFHKPHSTELAGMHDNPFGDDRFLNNVFIRHADLSQYDQARLPATCAGNVFLDGAKPCKHEREPSEARPGATIRLEDKPDGLHLALTLGDGWTGKSQRSEVTTALLGNAKIPAAPYELPDGHPLQINRDYLGIARRKTNPSPGPFEDAASGSLTIKVWPR